MQIDFHHATTYVLARLAGFEHPEADIIAHSAQYVDDATNSGAINFTNGAAYHRICSAHKMIDYRNFEALANHQVWIPFHFLPGNGKLPSDKNPNGKFIEKIICKPNSYVAKEMVSACIKDKHRLYALHRLGITLHVYADTWAHQGFAGVTHKINDISHLEDKDTQGKTIVSKLKSFFGDLFDVELSKLVGDTLPLGHGAALSFPDKPFLNWSYQDHTGKTINRDNPKDYIEACEELCKAMQRFRIGDPDADVQGLPINDRNKIEGLFKTIQDDKGEDRHNKWLEYIANGHFSFPGIRLSYIAKGYGSWKHQALNTTEAVDLNFEKYKKFEYHPEFLSSDWKLFHDALQVHRFDVIHNILPKYGICAA